ncbi:hypothetical protein BGX14_2598 [Fibrobacter sp. UWS1]|nr:hypothetical protein BGX14_2598 [Fibrobacter sp. UWS1]
MENQVFFYLLDLLWRLVLGYFSVRSYTSVNVIGKNFPFLQKNGLYF